MSTKQTSEQRLTLPLGRNGLERNLAVSVMPGAEPAILWLGGFRSDMTSIKAEALRSWGQANGRKVVRFDYMGHGESSGDFAKGTISIWLEDALAVIRALGGKAPVLVGSSMGGWISLLAARQLKAESSPSFPSRVVLIAPAVDFTEALIWQQMDSAIRQEVETTGQWLRHTSYAPDPYPITRELIEDGRRHLLFGAPFAVGCRIQILQGMQDPDVPPSHSFRLIEHLLQDEVTLTSIPDGDHRLSRPEDIATLLRIVGDGG